MHCKSRRTTRGAFGRPVTAAAGWVLVAWALTGCAAAPAPATQTESSFQSRAQTRSSGDATVTVAVPTDEEARSIYGVDLASREIQPVWIRVENDGEEPVWLLPSGLDPAYYATREAAYAFDPGDGSVTRHFERLQFQNPVYPGTASEGFLIVNRDEGYKALDVDLLSRLNARSFTFIVPDPAFKGDFTLVDFETLYAEDAIVRIDDLSELAIVLEDLPCCTTNEDNDDKGDPLNLVLIGDAEDIFPAFIRRGWHGTEVIWSKSLLRTVGSFLQGSRYRYSPVSPLYVFGRRQDLAAQKARGTIHERNHLRLWLTHLRYQGQAVWVGQISRDIGVKFTLKSPTISTHVIDPDVDEARRYLVEDLAYSQALAAVGWIGGVGIVTEEAPRYNLVGDPWFTDGTRAVMFFEPRPRALSDLEFIEFEARPNE